MKPKPEDPITTGLKCLCGAKECEIELRVIDMPEGQVKIQIFNSKDIDSIMVNKADLKKLIK